MKIRVALVGANGYAKVHLNSLKKFIDSGEIELQAAVILPREQTPETMEYFNSVKCRVFDSLDDMYQHCTPELVCLPIGIAFHEPMTRLCLSKGSNVLVEKPAAGSVEAVKRMIQAEKKSECFAAVGFQHIYSPELRKIKSVLLSGKLGEIESIHVMGIWPRANTYYARNNWAGRIRDNSGTLVLDSPLNNAFAHYLNLPLFLAGAEFEEFATPSAINGQLWRARKNIEYFDTCGVQLETEEKVRICAYFSHAHNETRHPLIHIKCGKGKVVIDFNGNTWNTDGAVIENGTISPLLPSMFTEVLAKVHDRSKFVCTLENAEQHTWCIEKLYENCKPLDIKDDLLTTGEDGQVIIQNLHENFRRCFEAGSPLSF